MGKFYGRFRWRSAAGELMEKLVPLAAKSRAAARWLEPDFAGRIGFPAYVLSNLGGNIRRIRERIDDLEATAGDETPEEAIGDVRMVDDVEANRLRLYFPGKPDEETRRRLKSFGFRWCRSEGCWQAFRGNGATAKAKAILEA